MRIDTSLVYLSYHADRINTQVIYRFLVPGNFEAKHDVTVTLGWQNSRYNMLQSRIFNCTNMHFFAIHENKIIVEISEIKVHVFRKLETKQGNMDTRW